MLGGFVNRLRGSQAGPAPAAAAQELPAYLRDHDGPHAARTRTGTTDRLVVMLLGTSLALNCVLGVAILQLLPLYRVVPFFVTFDSKSDQIVRIDPPTANMTSLEVMTEQEVDSYIIKRNTVSNDPVETRDRWGIHILRTSSKQVYEEFQKEIAPVYEDLNQRKFTRTVSIISRTKDKLSGVYRVDFQVVDRRIGAGLTDGGEERSEFTAQLRVENIPQNVVYSDRFINPLGFTVVAYSVVRKRQ